MSERPSESVSESAGEVESGRWSLYEGKRLTETGSPEVLSPGRLFGCPQVLPAPAGSGTWSPSGRERGSGSHPTPGGRSAWGGAQTGRRSGCGCPGEIGGDPGTIGVVHTLYSCCACCTAVPWTLEGCETSCGAPCWTDCGSPVCRNCGSGSGGGGGLRRERRGSGAL